MEVHPEVLVLLEVPQVGEIVLAVEEVVVVEVAAGEVQEVLDRKKHEKIVLFDFNLHFSGLEIFCSNL